MESDSRGWSPLHRAAVQPVLEVLETVLRCESVSLCEAASDGNEAELLAGSDKRQQVDVRG